MIEIAGDANAPLLIKRSYNKDSASPCETQCGAAAKASSGAARLTLLPNRVKAGSEQDILPCAAF
jgi:hypothetical protein